MSAFIHTDVATRDLDFLRARASRKANAGSIITAAAVGAGCGIQPGNGAAMPGACQSYDLDYLCNNYQTTTVVFRALAGQAVTSVPVNPLDGFFCPVAISAEAWDSVDGATPREFWLMQASIRGCFQYNWQNTTNTVAGAVGFQHSRELDPFARSGCACPINWGCFTNTAMSSAQLTLDIGNPQPVGITVTGKITLFGIAYSCCPTWANGTEGMIQPRRSSGAGQPMGNAARSPFAQ